MNIQNLYLTETGTKKCNQFFSEVAKDSIKNDACMFATMLEVLGVMQDRAGNGESLVYELGQQFTITGRPELLILDAEDVEIELCADEPEMR